MQVKVHTTELIHKCCSEMLQCTYTFYTGTLKRLLEIYFSPTDEGSGVISTALIACRPGKAAALCGPRELNISPTDMVRHLRS